MRLNIIENEEMEMTCFTLANSKTSKDTFVKNLGQYY